MDNRFILRWIQFFLLWGGGLTIAYFLLEDFNSQLFVDGMLICIYLLVAIINFRDKNLLGAILVLVVVGIANNIARFAYFSSDYVELGVALLCGLICLRFWYDRWAKIIAATALLSFCAQLFWHITQYETVVPLSLFLIAGTLNIGKRHYILYRTSWSRQWSSNIYFVNLDWQIYDITRVVCIICLLALGEFFLQHFFNLQTAFVGLAYPYLIYGVNAAFLYFIFRHIKLDKTKFGA